MQLGRAGMQAWTTELGRAASGAAQCLVVICGGGRERRREREREREGWREREKDEVTGGEE